MARRTTTPVRTGVYGGASADQRRADRRRRLMDAALEMIGTEGWSQTSMRGVCERAQVGPRFLYESFEDLDALAVAVLDEIVRDTLTKALAAIDAAPTDDLQAQVRAGIGTVIAELTDDPRRARMLFAEAHGSGPLMRGRLDAIRAIATALVGQTHRVVDLPAGSDAFVGATGLLIAGGIAEMVLVWLQGDLDLSREQLIELATQLVLTIGDNAPAIATRIATPAA